MASSTTNGAGPQPRRGVKQVLSSYFYWTYPRGSFHYDIMVTLILLFIFVTPHLWDYRRQAAAGCRPCASYAGGRKRRRRHRHRAGLGREHSRGRFVSGR